MQGELMISLYSTLTVPSRVNCRSGGIQSVKSVVKSQVQQGISLCESLLAKCIQETTRMAIPTSTIKTATKVLIQVIALSSYAGTAHGSSLSKLPVPEVITTATTNTTQGPIVPNDVTNLEEPRRG
ncbi:hypothetical protein BSL78_20868 [Apostichopus japonicus]|uniref:Uncharacterized protein n=1 Tax=Stichopus japonicus TaxID=307972 RepID=A0A2G8K2P3_STIJA|nr:hypothetical protein BSL78_20868 [Apostichopus japonicus]